MIKKIITSLIIISTILVNKIYGQDSLKTKIITVQPKIMVIPFTKNGEDIRTVLEENITTRVVISKVKEKFDLRGFTTIDFLAKLKTTNESNAFNSDNQNDLKSTIISNSGADIYVTSEIDYQKSASGNSITLVLTAFEASTGNSISNKVGFSGKFYTEDVSKLASKSVDNCIDEFLNIMQSKFSEIQLNGKSINVEISFNQDSKYNFTTEIEGMPLSDNIEEWFSKNSFNNNYHIQGTSSLKMIFDEVKIPLKDTENGKNYNPNKFALLLYKYLKDKKLEPTKDIKGNTIYISIK